MSTVLQNRNIGASNQSQTSELLNQEAPTTNVNEVEELTSGKGGVRKLPAITIKQEMPIGRLKLYGILFGLFAAILGLGLQMKWELRSLNYELSDKENIIMKQGREIQQVRDSLTDSLTELKKGLIKNVGVRESLCLSGLKSKEIPDSAFKATSSWDSNHGERLARLDNTRSGNTVGAWCSQYNRVGQWIQVDLGRPSYIAGVIIQGRPQYKNQFVKSFKVACGNTEDNLIIIRESGGDKVFVGNSNRDTKVTNKFPEVMTCRFVRIYPQTWNEHMSMRLEIIQGICFDLY